MNEGATPVRVQPGVYRLEVFTVFLGDTLECVADPAAPGGQRCAQPTLGPGQVCGLDVAVVAGSETRAIVPHPARSDCCGLELEPPRRLLDQEAQQDEHEPDADDDAAPRWAWRRRISIATDAPVVDVSRTPPRQAS